MHEFIVQYCLRCAQIYKRRTKRICTSKIFMNEKEKFATHKLNAKQQHHFMNDVMHGENKKAQKPKMELVDRR